MKQPPKYFRHLIHWLCRSEHAEELLGDLDERYEMNAEEQGSRYAARRYRKEVLLLLRPSAIRLPGFLGRVNRNLMIASHTRTTWRHLKRNPLFSLINIVGLSISMAVGILAITFVEEMYSYDAFHENGDQIYRVTNDKIYENADRGAYATTSLLLGEKLKADYGYEDLTLLMNSYIGQLRPVDSDKTPLDVQGIHADEMFLQIFSFPLIAGNPQTALADPYSIVISEELAVKLFGSSDVVGRTIERKEDRYQVTGVLENVPSNSHLKFEAIISLETLRLGKNAKHLFEDWGTMWSSYVYVRLRDTQSVEQLQTQLNQMAKLQNEQLFRESIHPSLENLAEIAPNTGKYNQQSTLVPQSMISMIIVLAIVVLVSACFNYANLSIARSLKRAREVGIRKVAGAGSIQITYQFLFEAIAMALIALVVAFFIFMSIRSEFLELNFFISRTTTLAVKPVLYAYFLGFAVLIGLLAGLVPAAMVSRYGIINSIKGLTIVRGNGNLRRLMIGVQFIFSMGLTILVVQAYRQYDFALSFDLGYRTDNILQVQVKDNDPDLLKEAFLSVPEVKSVALCSVLPSLGSLNSDNARVVGRADSSICYSNRVDRDYLMTMEHAFLAGGNFSGTVSGDQLIVNEQFVTEFELGTPQEALGTRVEYYNATRTIVGVVEDFHYGTIYNELRPFAFFETGESEPWWNMAIKIETSDLKATLGKLDAAWSSVDNAREFEATFYEEKIRLTYKSLESMLKLFGALAAIAVVVGLLGLLGMAVYTTESRKKELTIRKILGAEVIQILALLSRSFVLIFAIALVASVGLSYYLVDTMILKDAEYAIDVELGGLLASALPVAVVAFVVLILQGIATLQSNLVTNLRDD